MNRMKNRQNGFRAAAVLAALVILFSVIPAAPANAEKTGTVFGGWLILRSSPSFNGKIRSSYPTGTVVTITGQKGSWYAVTAPDGLTGYMLGDYLKVSGKSTPSTGSKAWVTSANGLNVRLRKGPGTGYSVLATYAPGTECSVLSSGSSWCKIKIGSYTGYMMSRYLTTTNPNSVPAPAPSPEETIPVGSQYTVWVTSRNGLGVNLRAGPSKSYSSIGFYGVGTGATMISSGAVWSYIQVGNKSGYMMSEFLTTNSPIKPVTPSAADTGAYVVSANGKSVNLRTGPSKTNRVIHSYPVGTPLTVITRGTDWYFIHIGQDYGYMMRTFIYEIPQSGQNPATQTDLH